MCGCRGRGAAVTEMAQRPGPPGSPVQFPWAPRHRWGAPALQPFSEAPLPGAPRPHLLHDALSAVVDNLLQAFGEVHL